MQIRYNGLLSSNDKVSCEQCDRSWGTTATMMWNQIICLLEERELSLQAKYILTYISIFNPI
jgi:hypothetical protein